MLSRLRHMLPNLIARGKGILTRCPRPTFTSVCALVCALGIWLRPPVVVVRGEAPSKRSPCGQSVVAMKARPAQSVKQPTLIEPLLPMPDPAFAKGLSDGFENSASK
jgi:hypothetical protein